MTHLSFEHDLIKDTMGATSTMSMVLPRGTLAVAVFDELNFDKRAIVRSGRFVAPITRRERDQFLAYVLTFNRNAISVMNCGLVPDPQTDCAFTPMWYVPKFAQTSKEWHEQFALFESLVMICGENLQRILQEWTANYLH